MRTRTLLRTPAFEVNVSLDEALAGRVRTAAHGLLRAAQTIAGIAPRKDHTVAEVLSDTPAARLSPEHAALAARVDSASWYHTIDLGNGVVTPGFLDHRPVVACYGLPDRLDGLRTLDVATYNGFWAFELERRRASEVVAIDIDNFDQVDLAPARRATMTREELHAPIGKGFEIAREALRSRVCRKVVDVYALSPERVGTFDVIFCSDLLLHLTNPIRALQNIRSVCTGSAIIAEMFNPALDRCGPYRAMDYRGGTQDYVWWTFGMRTLEQMILDSGFRRVDLVQTFDLLPRGVTKGLPHAAFRATA
jgi:tRNA (mo5U34)-methyltransferase